MKYFFLLIIVISFLGCKNSDSEPEKETYSYTYVNYKPIKATRKTLVDSIAVIPSKTIKESGKIYIKDQYVFVAEERKGFHVYDNSNPSNPTAKHFLQIPGCTDMAIRGDVIYVNQATDLVAFEYDGNTLKETKRVKNVFPQLSSPQGWIPNIEDSVVIGWRADTVTAEYERNNEIAVMESGGATPVNTSSNASSDGQGGSLARFILKGDHLYTVDEQSLHVFNILNTKNPVQVNTEELGFNIETLFNHKDYLYIGSQSGMFIYGTTNPEKPNKLSEVQHFTACDPVIANDTVAFVTLHSNTWCGNNVNQLEVYDTKNITTPKLLTTRGLVEPKGIGLYDKYLFVCDDEIKVFDVSDPKKIFFVKALNHYAFDVIIKGDHLIAIGKNGLYQYEILTNSGLSFNELGSITF